jgi:hypothetical protein
MQQYPTVPLDADTSKLVDILAYIQRLRQDDIGDNDNLINTFVSGRRVGKIPTASNDVATTDRLNDVSVALNAAYIYFLVDNAGTREWRRVTMASF